MTLIVAVPEDRGSTALSGIEGIRAVRYTAGEPLDADAAAAEVLVPGFLSADDVAELLGQLPNLRLVQLLSAGAENWLGRLPESVQLSTCRGAHGGSTAEWAMTALLTIYREFVEFDINRRERRWNQHRTDTLQDKRVLVVGAGDLGREMARRLEAFDAHATLVGHRARDGVRGVAELPELLGWHDAVVLMVPLTSATTGLVDAGFLAGMPDGAVLVNAARGSVVDTGALLAELRSGRLRAALDVTDPEPLPEDHPLWTVEGLLLTPHIGGSCTGLEDRAWAVAAAEISRFAAGERPHNLVDGEY
ncbi:MAG: 2-hydroxyacid dehydrogenase [Sciscionella sp.]